MFRPLVRVVRALRSLMRSSRHERDLDDELQFHLDMDAADSMRRGVPPEDAALAARRNLGSPASIKEQIRELRLTSPLEQFGRDIRGALRGMRRAPGFAVAVILTLGLGIGAVTTMFSITSGILRDLPVPEPGRLVHLEAVDRRGSEGGRGLRSWEFNTLAREQRSLQALAAYGDETFHVGDATAGRFAERWSGAVVTPGTFAMLGVAPQLGRSFTPDDGLPGAEPVVILGDALWERRYNSDAAVIGGVIRLNGTPYMVIGIMPPGFRFPMGQDLWVAFVPPPEALPGEGPGWTAFGRLRDGVSIKQARAEFSVLAGRLAAEAPDVSADRTVRVRPYRDELVSPDGRIIARTMLLVVSFVLLVACANAANLLLTRSIARRPEMAVRAALGAARYRIVVQVLTEVLVLATAAGLVGVGLAWVGTGVFSRMLAHELPFWMAVRVDPHVVLFAFGAVVLAAAAAGLAPARQALRVDGGDVLRERGRGSGRLWRAGRWLVGGEVALASALLVITGLMVSGVMHRVDRFAGLRPEAVLTARVQLREEAYPDSASVARYFAGLHERLAALPMVQAVAFGTVLPGFDAAVMGVALEGRVEPGSALPDTRVLAVSPGYFTTFGAGIVQGRDLAWADVSETPPVALVNQRFVERHLAGGSPIGMRLRLGADPEAGWMTIVGVVPDLGSRGRLGDQDAVYLSMVQRGERAAALALRVDGDPLALVPALRGRVRDLDAEVPVYAIDRLDRVIGLATAGERVFGGLFSVFGLSALVMASVGLSGLVAFAVRQRTRELGIRVALGARPVEIVGQVARTALWQLGGGIAVGLSLAALLAPLFGDALHGAEPRDYRFYLLVATVLAGVGCLAAWLPARRALRLAPADVLRED